ncbi:MAG: T9SS type A sorting domain-containing protein [Chlorobi bacterium]|nr:T9SS type A sorting domain-containing protein [Chlorobiota bacterium]
MKTFSFLPLLILLTNAQIYSQYVPSLERGDPQYRTLTQLEANQIRATVHNFGYIGRTGGQYPITVQTPFEWPKNSGHVYMALNAIFIGAEVADDNGDTIHIVDVPIFRSSPAGTSWNFEPIPGYFNEDRREIANSIEPDTWPESWPDKMNDQSDPGWTDSWNGYLGKNKFINGQELYYRFSDDRYDRYSLYSPDSTDLTRKGLGLIVSARAFSFTDTPFEDLIYLVYTIKNDGTKQLNKMALTMWAADFVGGNVDSQDDLIGYDITKNLVWFYDRDNSAPLFGNSPVGSIGISFIKTPELNDGGKTPKIFNVRYLPAGSINFNSVSDEELWQDFMTGGEFVNPDDIPMGEYDGFISSGYFSLSPGDSAEFVFAIILANGPATDNDHSIRISEIERKAEYAKKFFNCGFNQNEFTVDITNPLNSELVNGTVDISWTNDGAEGSAESIIFISTDMGENWTFLGETQPDEQYFTWNTKNTPNGILNKIAVYTFAENGVVGSVTQRFTIFNPENESIPQIYISSPKANDELSEDYEVEWISGCADQSINVTAQLYYRESANVNWTQFTNVNAGDNFLWKTNEYPNSNEYELLGKIDWDGGSDSVLVSPFSLYNQRFTPDDTLTNIVKKSKGTGEFSIHVINGAEVTGHSYSVTFMRPTCQDCNELFYSVFDNFSGIEKAVGVVSESSAIEGPYFDGLRLVIVNDSIRIDSLKSGWNNNDIYDYQFELVYTRDEHGSPSPNDYEIIFSDDVGFGVSKEFTLSDVTYPSMPVNFKVRNIDDDKWIDFGFIEIDDTDGAGRFTANGAAKDRIVFLEQSGKDSLFTYWIYLSTEKGGRFPSGGDTLSVFQFKPYSITDTIFFNTTNITGVRNETAEVEKFQLSQNYPNPFNPSTKILFQIPKTGFVEIKIFDILGREIETLVSAKLSAGKYETVFNAKNLASGVYFYQLRTDGFSTTKKMLLLR